jgi:hypothetical protein
MDCTKLSKVDAINQLIQFVHKGSAAGAYRIEEGKSLDNALAHFDESVADKPKLTTDDVDQTVVAADLLAQACRVALPMSARPVSTPSATRLVSLT